MDQFFQNVRRDLINMDRIPLFFQNLRRTRKLKMTQNL